MKILDVPKSGSLAGTTHSRNRFGQYQRSRAIPVQPRSTAQTNTRNRQTVNAAAWRALTSLQRAAWQSLGASMSRTDALGQAYTLTGFQAFCSVNNTLAAAGTALVSDPPSLITPTGLSTATVTLTHAAFSIAFTPSPLAAGQKIVVRVSPQRSAGRSFEGDYRRIFTGAAASASPADVFAAYSAKFGAPVVGNKLFISASVMDSGFESGPFLVGQVVV